MKKTRKEPRVDDLMVDVLEYAFTEWLVRRKVFSLFKANFTAGFSSSKSFRDRLRALIRYSINCSKSGPKGLISAAFIFLLTPEGIDFWTKEVVAWDRFYSKFQVKR